MERDRLSRKLAVILHADVVGSTLLVQKNETLAHERIQAAFNSFSETIAVYGGKAHEIRGDALVAEFNRASDAVPAAIAFQVLNEESNSVLNDDIQPQLRIGISLGEVIVACEYFIPWGLCDYGHSSLSRLEPRVWRRCEDFVKSDIKVRCIDCRLLDGDYCLVGEYPVTGKDKEVSCQEFC
jgi:hypothetical protein